MILFNFVSSVIIILSLSGRAFFNFNKIFFSFAFALKIEYCSNNNLFKVIGVLLTVTCFVPSFEISRISLIIRNNCLPLLLIILIYCFLFSSLKFGLLRNSENPIIPFKGVRISCDIFCINSVFNSLLSSACFLAIFRSSFAVLNSSFSDAYSLFCSIRFNSAFFSFVLSSYIATILPFGNLYT